MFREYRFIIYGIQSFVQHSCDNILKQLLGAIKCHKMLKQSLCTCKTGVGGTWNKLSDGWVEVIRQCINLSESFGASSVLPDIGIQTFK